MSILEQNTFGEAWTMGSVLHHLSNHGEIPKNRVLSSVRILEELTREAALTKHYRDSHMASKRLHVAVRVALSNNDSLRAVTLIIDWEKEYAP